MTGRIPYSDILPATSDSLQRQFWLWSLQIAGGKRGHLRSKIDGTMDPTYKSKWKA